VALNVRRSALHRRTPAARFVDRLLDAAVGAGLAGAGLHAAGFDARTVRRVMLVACGVCLTVGFPAGLALRGRPSSSGKTRPSAADRHRTDQNPSAR
jgi:hypothetical protein